MFKNDEFERLRERVRTELLPRLDDVRQGWQSNHRSEDSPDEHMQPFVQSLESLKACFSEDASAIKIIDQEARRSQEWIDENGVEERERSPRQQLGDMKTLGEPEGTRSIFDDIDAGEDSSESG